MKELKIVIRDLRNEIPQSLMREYERKFIELKANEIKQEEEVKKDPDENILTIDERKQNFPKAKVMRIELQKNQHDNTKVTNHQCDICKKYFAYKQSLLNHVELHYKGTPKMTEKIFKREVTRPQVGWTNKTKFSDHQCKICLKYFSTSTGLKSHVECHFKFSNFECKKCMKTFSNARFLKFHICKTEAQCNECKTTYDTTVKLRRHMKKVHGVLFISGELICDFCGCGFKNKSGMAHHHKLCPGRFQRDFSCDQCDRKFPIKSEIEVHVLNHAIHKIQCNYCDKKIKPRGLSHHISISHSLKGEKFPCQNCPKVFESLYKLRRHSKGHDKKYKCHICSREFTIITQLKYHLKFHENPEQFRCQLCKTHLSSQAKLNRHMKTHDKNRVKHLKCPQCDFKTDNSSHLKRHLQTHDKNREKPFKCQRCDYSFDNKTNLRTHMKSHEFQDKRFKKLPNAMRCQKCSLVLNDEKSLECHMKCTHEKVNKYECHICQKLLSSKKNILNHFIAIHKIKL